MGGGCGLVPICAAETVSSPLSKDNFSAVDLPYQHTVVRTNWAMEKTIEAHLSRIKDHLATGRDVLRSLQESELTTYSIPDVTSDRTVLHLHPPRDTDKYSSLTLSTDTTNHFPPPQ
jgi:hypothetical protein